MVVAGRRIYAFRPYIFCPPFPAAPAAADKARDFGAGPLFNQILPLLMSPTLEDQERHLLVKVRCGAVLFNGCLLRSYCPPQTPTLTSTDPHLLPPALLPRR